MNQDRNQKSDALKYVVSKLWFPQLELDVTGFLTTSSAPLHITDVDVYASVPDDLDCLPGVVIDCKTDQGVSPVNRALWQAGLMTRMNAKKGICIAKKSSIGADHRYLASRLGITLLTEEEFRNYANATAPGMSSISSHVSDIVLWDKFYGIPSRYSRLESAVKFSSSGFWMTDSFAEACRKALILGGKLRSELDPAKAEHVAIVLDLCALFMHAFAHVVHEIFSGYLMPDKRDSLSEALLILIYGGRESYEHRNNLKKRLAKKDGLQNAADLALPDWERFVQLARQSLDAPLETQRVPLLLRELAWGYLGDANEPSTLATYISKMYRFAPKFGLLAISYVCRACGFPSDFEKRITSQLVALT